jgi:integrase
MLVSAWAVDPVKLLTPRELASVLVDLARRAPRSASLRMNRMIFRLACCCGLRVSEIGALRLADVCVDAVGRTSESALTGLKVGSPAPSLCGGTLAHFRTLPSGSASGRPREPGGHSPRGVYIPQIAARFRVPPARDVWRPARGAP